MPRLVKAHSHATTIRLIELWPDHTPRRDDPYYSEFRKAKARMKAAGLLVCAVDSEHHAGAIELHHNKVEYAHINDVDVAKFNEFYGLELSDEDFRKYVEGPGNLEPLCTLHHRGTEGVHSLPDPIWNVLRVAKRHHRIVMVQSNSGIPVPPSGRLEATV